MPPRQQGVAVLWYWCIKNRVWSIRNCGHSKCAYPTVRSEQRPIEAPR